MPSFLVTMATLTIFGGVSVWLTRGQPITGLPTEFVQLCRSDWLSIPFAVWVAGSVCLAAHLLLNRTTFGRQLRAVGYNPATSRVSGVPVDQRMIMAFVISGVCSTIAAALYTAQLGAARPRILAPESLLDVLGAAVVGGASLRGGRGTVFGMVAGVVFIALVGNGLDLLGLDSWHVVMAKGLLIFAAAAVDVARIRGERT
jgi:ribose transport system permease protein